MGRGEVGAPPQFPTVADFDGSWHFCRLMYRQVRSQQRGLGWGTDYPNADINFSTRLSELTTSGGRPRCELPPITVRPTDPELSQCPFVMAIRIRAAPVFQPRTPRDCATTSSRAASSGSTTSGAPGRGSIHRRDREGAAAGEFPVKEITVEHPIYRMLFPVAQDSAGAVDAVLAHDAAERLPRWTSTAPTRTWRRSPTSRAASWC